ncbi:uncharacterized protein BX664DRAFT_266122 [Halteromyces radiatus]|uniref:uncharacterized protein n=1 Tax=Halteromyces radiatus TaxID=101107 RepID=UPI0022211A0E|nr:uncharacterized protein BX664DRAFT_266122 [Halteromyces radiatus]KAI8084573.1 hypothetical protein BX664DRAFT_266122 [Halteromyces radiatus]
MASSLSTTNATTTTTNQSSPRPASSSPLQDDSQTPHLLTLKVMRLTRPLLSTHSPVYYEKQTDNLSSLVEGLEAINISDLSANHPIQEDGSIINIRDFGLSQMLKLPAAFGNIYLGESFSTLISFNNDTLTETVYQVGAKIELQTASQRFSLYDTLNNTQATMDPGTNHQVTVSHEIKELGVHILVCSVHYVNPDDGRVFMEAQVQNVSAGPMFLERMKFEPSEYFDYENLNQIQQQQEQQQQLLDSAIDPSSSVFGDSFIHPQDVRQYLYLLTPKPSQKDRIARTTNALGKLDIVWRSAMGDMGRLQTSQLTRKAPALEDIEVQPIDATVYIKDGKTTTTDRVILEKPFQLKIKVRNHSTQHMNLVLSANKTKMGSVLLSGLGSRELGDLAPNQSTETQLEFFPLTPGLQRVGGLKVVDTTTGYTKDVDHLCDVFVLSNTNEIIFTTETSIFPPPTTWDQKLEAAESAAQTSTVQAVDQLVDLDKLMYYAKSLKNGKMPTNLQLKSLLKRIRTNPEIERRSQSMSQDGQNLLDDFRELVTILEDCLDEKNGSELTQSLIYHLRNVDLKPMLTHLLFSIIGFKHLQLIAKLIFINDEFQGVMNEILDVTKDIIQSNIKEKTEQWQVEPEEQLGLKEEAKQKTKQVQPKERDTVKDDLQSRFNQQDLIRRLKHVMLQVQKNSEYQQALDLLEDSFSKWFGQAGKMANQMGTVATDTVQQLKSDRNFSQASLEAKTIAEDWAQGQSLDPLIDTINKIFSDVKNDPRLNDYSWDYIKRLVREPGYVQDEQSTKDGQQLLERGRSEQFDSYRRTINEAFDQAISFFNAIAQDPTAIEIRNALKNIKRDLWLDEEGNMTFKPHLFKDIAVTVIPAVLDQVNSVPIPHIEYHDDKIDVAVENLILSGSTVLPNEVDFKMYNHLQYTQKTKANNQQTLYMHFSGIQIQMKDVVFYYKKMGFPSISDRGIADLNVSALYINGKGKYETDIFFIITLLSLNRLMVKVLV